MSVAGAPESVTDFLFIQNRIEAAKTIQPARRGYRMFESLATVGLFSYELYTYVAIVPGSFIAIGILPIL